MSTPLVITTINSPTRAIKEFRNQDLNVIIVGDEKTPKNWTLDGVTYLSYEKQKTLGFKILDLLPTNTYSRKNVGYLFAMLNNPNMIAESDDDNIPLGNWKLEISDGLVHITLPDLGFTNVYSYFTDKYIWPRGLPLDEIANNPVIRKSDMNQNKIGIFQGLADNDPDVDAIYRLVIDKYVTFEKKIPLVLDKNTIAPINSQNTMFIRKFFSLMYLPSYVSFRFIDILRGLIAQPIMWLYGYKTVFLSPTVYQERNFHDLMTDFRQEIECYIYPKQIIIEIKKVISSDYTVNQNLISAYEKLIEIGICNQKELNVLKAWIEDVEKTLT